jgi:glycosyltransferase involved in cell wall biosynthesis
MKLEVLLSAMNLNKKDLDKMNITSKSTVINQCGKENFEKYKNFNIYSYDEIGTSNSRNRGLEHITEDIILLCDDDVVYNKDYEKIVLEEFKKNPKADVIIFNFNVKNRKKRIIKKRKKLHIYNSLNYATYNIAFKKNSILNNNIKFNTMFGPGAKYNNGEDSLFIRNLHKNKLKVYSSSEYLGTVYNEKSTWFKGYNEKFFFNKGALFTAINPKIRHILILQYLIRHKETLINLKFRKALKIMLQGSKDFLKTNKKIKRI